MKGDVCRSRLVVRESKRRTTWPGDVFSPMPPSEGLKMLVSTMMTDATMTVTQMDQWRWQRGACHELTCTEMPAGGSTLSSEWIRTSCGVARLCRSMCGTRDAASISRDTWSELLKDGSVRVGAACPAFFCDQDGNLTGGGHF